MMTLLMCGKRLITCTRHKKRVICNHKSGFPFALHKIWCKFKVEVKLQSSEALKNCLLKVVSEILFCIVIACVLVLMFRPPPPIA